MNALRRVWDHFEEGFIAFLLAAMTLVTFVYVILNNLYTLFYNLADRWEGSSELFFAIGDSILGMAQSMTWSIALTKALFAWLIFFGLAYGVRTAGHIGVDALVKLASKPVQRVIGLIACLACLGYAGLITVASFDWVKTLFTAGIGAEDLGHYGIMQWHITLIVPFGYAMVFIRFLEIFVRILRNQQTGLGLADEAAEALKINEHGEHKQ
ncbi:MAG: TRAP transporter small permease [Pseudomonas sp.]|uniref:TRAP transporter small permease n=1 Tax=Pseudomonas sp. TaxID=306 RepID=UPI00271D2EDD|nr:TRAP transporter small permease [Pseudomonas sp.]MDO9616325.1 TRAP transporter small permease [Pseudomonas sp.]MDP2447078.1 TRAP transporter small permease [Pseudomonas sp.]MDZ4334088.1 TRAP transporter small permease [Pseudomonas sp.]